MPPRLPIDHFQSARSPSQSVLSSPNTSLLSPAISDPWDRSPPPRPETDDYIGSKSRREYKERQKGKHARKCQNTREESLVATPCEDSAAHNPHSDYGLYGAGKQSKGSNNVLRRPSHRIAGSSTTANQKLALRDAILTTDTKTLVHTPSSETLNASKSPAVTALRRLSQPVPPGLISSPNAARRISTAVSATLGFRVTPKASSSGSQSPENNTVKSPIQRLHQSSFQRSVDQGGCRRASTSRDQLEVPATITVRKASTTDRYESRSISTKPVVTSNHKNGEARINPPSVELVAFYSENRKGATPQTSHRTFDTSMAALTHRETRPNSIAQLNEFTNSRRQSVAADVAITFADVHIAPGTFGAQHVPRLGTLGFNEITQRASTVQFRTRDSVHEIIWREDEAHSGGSFSCSSHGSSSPDRSTQFQTIGGLAPDDNASHSEPPQEIMEQNTTVPFWNPSDDLSSTQRQAGLLKFTWKAPEDAPASEVERHTGGASSTSPVAHDPSKNFTNPTISEHSSPEAEEVDSVKEGDRHVASFPPLPARQSTSEWCRAPLVDLDDPLAGRAMADHCIAGRRAKTMQIMKSFPSSDEKQSYRRRLSGYAHSPSRVGSYLGVSSHRSKPLRRAV